MSRNLSLLRRRSRAVTSFRVPVRSIVAGVMLIAVWTGSLRGQASPLLAPCRFPGIPRGGRCGTYTVPENRADRRSRSIPLDVIVLPSRSAKPIRPDTGQFFSIRPDDVASRIHAARERAVAAGHVASLVDPEDVRESGARWIDCRRHGVLEDESVTHP